MVRLLVRSGVDLDGEAYKPNVYKSAREEAIHIADWYERESISQFLSECGRSDGK